jgi:hypothetical protein
MAWQAADRTTAPPRIAPIVATIEWFGLFLARFG